MRLHRRGESFFEVVGVLALIVVIYGGALWFFHQNRGDGGNGGFGFGGAPPKPPKPPEPNIVIIDFGQESNLFSADVGWAEVRNLGGAGDVTFRYTSNGGYLATHRTYFDAGERRMVRFTLPGLNSSNCGTEYRIRAQ